MRQAIWIALAACGAPQGVAAPTSPFEPTAAEMVACHLAPAYEGPLRWDPNDFAALDCVITNRSDADAEICGRPYVFVRTTGEVYTPHDPVCSSELAPGEVEQVTARLDMRRAACRRAGERGGCIVRMFPDVPSAAGDVVAFARGMQDQADAPGRSQPTVRECGPLVDRWTGNPRFARLAPQLRDRDAFVLTCLGLPRAAFDCLRYATDDHQVDACAR